MIACKLDDLLRSETYMLIQVSFRKYDMNLYFTSS
jgi:hypothetical protein